MAEIEFSVMVGSPGGASHLLPLLDAFKKEHGIKVNLNEVTWSAGWPEIVKFGIYGHGPDVSSIGTTWIGSLAAMQALRPFSQQEISALGGGEAFFSSIWNTGFLQNDPSTLWAVPWLGDAMLLYYWEHLLEKVGINNIETAFASDEALAETLEKLRRGGVEYPLAINVKSDSIILHEAAHWIWNAGGTFISPDGREVAFTQPAALQGLRNYFNLRPYISPELFDNVETGILFNMAKSAIHFAGPWLGTSMHRHPDWFGGIPRVISVPGTAFAGGSSLVIWKYTVHPQESFKLVKFLATQPVHIPTGIYDHQVPTRREAMHMPLMENDIFHRAYLQSMQQGRSFPSMRLWGAIEDKLRVALGSTWTDLFTNPNQDLNACIHKHLDPIAYRLNLTLAN